MNSLRFHHDFINSIRANFAFLEQPSESRQSPWMLRFYESICVPGLGRPAVACGYFDVFMKVGFIWEPWDEWLDARVYRLPDPRNFEQAAMMPIEWKHVGLESLIEAANSAWRPKMTRVSTIEQVEDCVRYLAEGLRPVVADIFEPVRSADLVSFPLFEKCAAEKK